MSLNLKVEVSNQFGMCSDTYYMKDKRATRRGGCGLDAIKLVRSTSKLVLISYVCVLLLEGARNGFDIEIRLCNLPQEDYRKKRADLLALF